MSDLSLAPDETVTLRLSRATTAQRRAADPLASVWVAASAGTGKTKVLTDRVLALMVIGTAPERVLCLTFTKAAAAEMANRLARKLGEWAILDDAALAKDLTALLDRLPSQEELTRARALFAAVLDASGGMKIQTIHSFCQSLLARFPLEAEVPPHFQPLDERAAAEMLTEAREVVLRQAVEEGEDSLLGRALAEISARVIPADFDQLMQGLIAERGRLERMLRRAGGLEALIARVHEALAVEVGTSAEALVEEACREAAFQREALAIAAAALAGGSEAERRKAETLQAWLAAEPAERARAFAAHRALFLTTEGEVRKTLLNKKTAAAPGALEAMEAEAERLLRLDAACRAAVVAAASAALLRLGEAILRCYGEAKRARAFLDYDDLILLTRELLSRPGVAPWVLYKLDGGLDHLLIDEAQDTNPEQWDVVAAISEEFFSGEGLAEASGRGPRTIFAVGDAKQSIYSFQRADPKAFAEMRRYFHRRAQEAERLWRSVALDVSFRSTPAVLAAVDAVFAQAAAKDGVLMGEPAIHHEAFRAGQGGLVELWPPAEDPKADAPEAWTPPSEADAVQPSRLRLARLVAERIRRWTQDGDPEGFLPSKGRQMRAGDVLVLVRRRGAFVEDLVRELKDREVPVAGVDRMVLTEQLAVMDLAALGRFLLLPEDDLTLASVLKGPLIGMSEERLFDLAYGREGSLWEALVARRSEAEDFAAAHGRLAAWLSRVDYRRPFEFYAELLGAEGGRAQLLARLGPDAADPIEEFLALAIAYEREHTPSMQGFLCWLETGRQEIKRDLEQDSDAVRVMTVHGAKGLQAPVVFLTDTMQLPRPPGGPVWLEGEGLFLWSPRKEYNETIITRARAGQRHAQEQEYRRLLYVAMTRAEDRLYLCGWAGRQAMAATCWYSLAAEGLAGIAEPFDFDCSDEIVGGWQGEGLRLTSPQIVAPQARSPKPDDISGALVEEAAPRPNWLTRPAPKEPAPPRPLAPSRPSGTEPAVRSPLASEAGADMRRGRLIHRLLQSLPELPREERAAAAARLLKEPAHGLAPTQQEAIAGEVLAILDHPDLAPIFGPGSRAEVPVVGTLDGGDGDGAEGPVVVSGQIDRLLVEEDRVLVVDYKTNRLAPERPEEVPEPYLQQMESYRRLLARVYPDRRVETWLVWTEGPRVMALR